jgi:hypothetical protein
MQNFDFTDLVAFKAASLLTSAASVAGASHADWSSEYFGVPLPVLLMAVAGAALALSLLPPMKTAQMAVSVALGTAIGVFLPQLLAAFYPSIKPALTAAAFFCGLGGKIVATMIFDEGRALAITWLKNKIGGAQ